MRTRENQGLKFHETWGPIQKGASFFWVIYQKPDKLILLMVVSLFDLFSGFMKIEDSRWRILSETWSFSQRHRWGFHQRVGSQNQQEIGFKGHVSMHKLTHTHTTGAR